eukprot:832787-Pelagomonas_calceolata.AAC.5
MNSSGTAWDKTFIGCVVGAWLHETSKFWECVMITFLYVTLNNFTICRVPFALPALTGTHKLSYTVKGNAEHSSFKFLRKAKTKVPAQKYPPRGTQHLPSIRVQHALLSL